MAYVAGDTSASLSVSDSFAGTLDDGSYAKGTITLTGSFSLSGSTTLNYTLKSTNSDGTSHMRGRAILCIDYLDSSGTPKTHRYDSTYVTSPGTFPTGHNTTHSGNCTIGNRAQTITIRLYICCMQNRDENNAATSGNSTAMYRYQYYTVTFKDGDTTLKTENVLSGGSVTPPSVSTKKLGYHQNGWNGTYQNVTSDQTVTLKWDKNQLIVNYYSNYANKVRDSEDGVTKNLESTQNVYIRQDKYTYGHEMTDTLRNYSGHSDKNTLIMRRHGYLPTRYWNTQPNGAGYSLHEGAGTPDVDTIPYVEDVAQWLGVNIDYNNVTINVYPQWELQTEMYILKDGTIYAGDFISSSSNYIDKNGTKIYASSFTEGSSTITWGADGFKAKAFRHGSPDFPYAASI
jgi:hypothetical protein